MTAPRPSPGPGQGTPGDASTRSVPVAAAPGPRHRHSRRRGERRDRRWASGRGLLRWVPTVVGLALVWSSLGFVGYAAGWTAHKDRAQEVLVGRSAAAVDARDDVVASPCVQGAPQTGQLAGTLVIPAIGLVAPVEQGTDDDELAVAAGHAPASVWPGAPGTSVFLAHDVSYFLHIGDLQPGDLVEYRDQCSTTTFRVTGQRIVTAGDPVDDSTAPTLVLDTCWPTNALFYTSRRRLVTADEVPTPTGPAGAGPAGPLPAVPVADTVTYTVPAPPALVAQGLTLEQNEVPMGTMTLTGSPSPVWEESPGPLALESAALEAYFAGLHAAAQRRADWWSDVAPGLPMPPAVDGGHVSSRGVPLDVTIAAPDGTPQSVTFTTAVTVVGGAEPGDYHESVTESVTGSVLTITDWELTDG